MATTETAALRKRQQIMKANRMMFVWVAAASALIGVSLVVSFLLLQRLTFNEKVLAEKNKTISTLKANNKAVDELKANVRLLESNEALAASKATSEENNLQVVLDALPADANSLAFGASLQGRLLSGINGLTVETAAVDPVKGIESTSKQLENTKNASVSSDGSFSKIDFRFTVIGSVEALNEVLKRLERSIRAISVTNVTTESNSGILKLSVEGHAFYEPARTIELKDKTVKP